MVFTDECKVFATHQGIEFIRKKDEEDWLDHRFIKQTTAFTKGVMIWAAINATGVLYFVRCESTID